MYKALIASFLFFVLGFNQLKAQESFIPEFNFMSSFELKIDGLSTKKGEIRIAIFNSKENYTKDPIYAEIISAECSVCVLSIENMPYGEYAIAVYHDKNENGKLDTNLLGIPKESYGFSNDARGKFGPASWEDARFIINEKSSKKVITIK